MTSTGIPLPPEASFLSTTNASMLTELRAHIWCLYRIPTHSI